ncbi:hypothetical protein QE433_001560 [Agrobacterium tumefaciens]|nr:hypothetical protein [Agrobacterium tumefaciens]
MGARQDAERGAGDESKCGGTAHQEQRVRQPFEYQPQHRSVKRKRPAEIESQHRAGVKPEAGQHRTVQTILLAQGIPQSGVAATDGDEIGVNRVTGCVFKQHEGKD